LVKAAEAGKQVVALVELKARFDEQANIERARMLEQAGAHVVYGLVGLKTHAKIVQVVRQEADGIRRYCHVGTGNYNPKTATTYEDLGVMSCDPDLGSDISELFNHLTGYSRPGEYQRLLVAPMHLRNEFVALIRSQARPDGVITMKMNALVDSEMIDELYAASNAGAQIDLIIRSICCLRAGVPGLSESIRVRSIVGRYLEHSRVFRFGRRGDPASEYVIGSADLMPRNLDRRVEADLRVTDPRMRARLDEILEINLADDVLAWTLQPDGAWRKVLPVEHVESQVRFQELAIARSKVRAPEA
jgi:polyphosphate kinase